MRDRDILSLFNNEFNEFNNTGACHMKLNQLEIARKRQDIAI